MMQWINRSPLGLRQVSQHSDQRSAHRGHPRHQGTKPRSGHALNSKLVGLALHGMCQKKTSWNQRRKYQGLPRVNRKSALEDKDLLLANTVLDPVRVGSNYVRVAKEKICNVSSMT